MMKLTITTALEALGFDDGWAANEADGIVLWQREEKQPTKKQLTDAGWIPQTIEETTAE